MLLRAGLMLGFFTLQRMAWQARCTGCGVPHAVPPGMKLLAGVSKGRSCVDFLDGTCGSAQSGQRAWHARRQPCHATLASLHCACSLSPCAAPQHASGGQRLRDVAAVAHAAVSAGVHLGGAPGEPLTNEGALAILQQLHLQHQVRFLIPRLRALGHCCIWCCSSGIINFTLSDALGRRPVGKHARGKASVYADV